MDSLEAYGKVRRKKIEAFQKVFAVVSIVSFLGSTAFATGRMFIDGLDHAQQPEITSPQAQHLEEQAKGYEIVLQREPKNQAALEGLLQVQLKMNDLAGTQATLEKLVELNPNDKNYQTLLAQVKQQISDRKP